MPHCPLPRGLRAWRRSERGRRAGSSLPSSQKCRRASRIAVRAGIAEDGLGLREQVNSHKRPWRRRVAIFDFQSSKGPDRQSQPVRAISLCQLEALGLQRLAVFVRIFAGLTCPAVARYCRRELGDRSPARSCRLSVAGEAKAV